jgi:hypothetical protein
VFEDFRRPQRPVAGWYMHPLLGTHIACLAAQKSMFFGCSYLSMGGDSY